MQVARVGDTGVAALDAASCLHHKCMILPAIRAICNARVPIFQARPLMSKGFFKGSERHH